MSTSPPEVFHRPKHASRIPSVGMRSSADTDAVAPAPSRLRSFTATEVEHTAAAAQLEASQRRLPSAFNSPIPAMHWSYLPQNGSFPSPLRAHTMTLVGHRLFAFGGCDSRACYNDLYVFDTEALYWSKAKTRGSIPDPCRAHSAVLLDRKLYVFGGEKHLHAPFSPDEIIEPSMSKGGDGPLYFASLHCLDTDSFIWTKLDVPGQGPGPRRAHTTWVYDGNIYVYAGGDGVRAISDIYMLNTRDALLNSNANAPASTPLPDLPNPPPSSGASSGVPLIWTQVATSGTPPSPRGYHTSNLIQGGTKVIVFGGSDGNECFSDVHVLDMIELRWHSVEVDRPFPRLSHTATQVGSYLFVLGGHDGRRYSNEVLLLNLVTMNWYVNCCFSPFPFILTGAL